MHIKYPHYVRRNIKLLTLSLVCLVSSFTLGIQTAGDVTPFQLIEAGGAQARGDVDGNGVVNVEDVVLILEVFEGYKTASPEQLRADPNGDGIFDVTDALSILSTLALR